MALFGGFIDFMSQDIVFYPLSGLCCLVMILVPIVLVVVLMRANKKPKTRPERDEDE